MTTDNALRRALEFYSEHYCEGWCKNMPQRFTFVDCGGCKAREALAAPQAHPQGAGDWLAWVETAMIEELIEETVVFRYPPIGKEPGRAFTIRTLPEWTSEDEWFLARKALAEAITLLGRNLQPPVSSDQSNKPK